jgi:hypothetical protein
MSEKKIPFIELWVVRVLDYSERGHSCPLGFDFA